MMSRRKFLILTGAVAAGAILPAQISAKTQFVESAEEVSAKRRWAMSIDVSKCTECMEEFIAKTGNPEVKPPCVVACDKENNVPEFKDKRIDPQWIRIAKLKLDQPSINPREFYMPLLCNHCEYPPCVEVCPTHASFKRPDGIVEIDMHRCIGCRYCMIACPYGARSFNFVDPRKGLKEINPNVPMRTEGVVEKCTFCVHRVDEAVAKGENPIPACVEACHKYGKGAMTFGNIKDPDSELSKTLKDNMPVQLRANLGTDPHVFYLKLGGE
ncbi:sulfate reduction electron transfer complex DsrMKJOP subunit DsrO [Archaeoglobus neptunius]|uniref:sulfate reduction electron transfer complex DsrMKJOP subunit DsrO n=1 Tax=Archaeoglobus neptunius TaxID=2798580 RepID=UPI0019297E66|nr:4Fe-4S dicluster domain-containing protein [Archaeoglobus neptunius]